MADGGGLSAHQRRLLVVRIGFEGEPSSYRAVPRFRLAPDAVNKLFNCDVEFLQCDADGTVLFPDSWAQLCLPPPAQYSIRERVWPTLEPDALEQPAYRGGSRVVVEHVPPALGAGALAAWLRAGLLDDDAEYAGHAQRLAELRERLAGVEREITALPSLPLPAAGGGVEPLAAKAARAQLLGAQRERLAREVAAQAAHWAALEGGGGGDGAFCARLAEARPPLGLATWELTFARTPQAQRMAYVAVHKYNWRDFRLAVRDADGAEPLTAKATFPAGALPPGHGEVNMRAVVVTRRKHGRGLHRFDDERGFYSGQWQRGLRHGQGAELSGAGRFQGRFERDWRRGPGSAVTPGGDAFRGPYGARAHHTRASLLFGDEYADGLPNGLGRLRCADGSVYEGSWVDGAPGGGRGRYVGADGSVLEGAFGAWGRLHGTGSEAGHGCTRLGRWRHGLLVGAGTELDAERGCYEGHFAAGLRHGFGSDELPGGGGGALAVAGRYDGWWRRGLRCGRGVLNFFEPPAVDVAGGGAAATRGPSADAEDAAAALRAAAELRAAADATASAPRGGGGGGVSSTASASPFLPLAAAPTTTVTAAGAGAAAGTSSSMIPYRGDYQLEGTWLGGQPRGGGGVFTYRRGSASHVAHAHALVHDGANPALPHVGALAPAEAALAAQRDTRRAAAARACLAARRAKEAENASSYAFWRARAEAAFARDVLRGTRRMRRAVELVREDVTGLRAAPADLGFSAGALAALAVQEGWLDGVDDEAPPPPGGGRDVGADDPDDAAAAGAEEEEEEEEEQVEPQYEQA